VERRAKKDRRGKLRGKRSDGAARRLLTDTLLKGEKSAPLWTWCEGGSEAGGRVQIPHRCKKVDLQQLEVERGPCGETNH